MASSIVEVTRDGLELKMQEIATKHGICRPREKYQNNQLKKKKVNVVASGKEKLGGDRK